MLLSSLTICSAFTFFSSIFPFGVSLLFAGLLFLGEQQGEPAADAKATTAKTTIHMKELSSHYYYFKITQ